jgi:hypothetical protein
VQLGQEIEQEKEKQTAQVLDESPADPNLNLNGQNSVHFRGPKESITGYQC